MLLRSCGLCIFYISFGVLSSCSTNTNVPKTFAFKPEAKQGIVAMSVKCSGTYHKMGALTYGYRDNWTEGWLNFDAGHFMGAGDMIYVVCNSKVKHYMVSLPPGKYGFSTFDLRYVKFDIKGGFDIHPSKVTYIGRLNISVDEDANILEQACSNESTSDINYFKTNYKNIAPKNYITAIAH